MGEVVATAPTSTSQLSLPHPYHYTRSIIFVPAVGSNQETYTYKSELSETLLHIPSALPARELKLTPSRPGS